MFQTLLSCAAVVGAALVANPGFAQDGLPLVVVAPNGIEHTLHLDDLDAMDILQCKFGELDEVILEKQRFKFHKPSL